MYFQAQSLKNVFSSSSPAISILIMSLLKTFFTPIVMFLIFCFFFFLLNFQVHCLHYVFVLACRLFLPWWPVDWEKKNAQAKSWEFHFILQTFLGLQAHEIAFQIMLRKLLWGGGGRGGNAYYSLKKARYLKDFNAFLYMGRCKNLG